ncbi:MAG: GDYXXLXY domain-containing protein [Candidatus Omnitrophota bacterium]|nr:MAG: GDYXXLXY domain-containing protein [Candidatus Omnitrophota bacterium]
MKKTMYIFALFCCVAVIQVATPISMIINKEMILKDGTQFRFKTRPVDPYDAFRGRYVALGIEQNNVVLTGSQKLQRGQMVYVCLGKDENGFAKIDKVTEKRPKGNAYIKSRVWSIRSKKAYFRLPFNRYYMDEKAAPQAEIAYRKHSRRSKRDAYITVRVKSGNAVIEELYISGIPIKEFVKREQK